MKVKRWIRYRLSSLVFGVVIVTGIAALLGPQIRRARNQRLLANVGASLIYEYELSDSGQYVANASPPWPTWLLDTLGEDFLCYATELGYVGGDHHMLSYIGQLSELESLYLGVNQISDEHLHCLRNLTRLRQLNLEQNFVTDEGLRIIGGVSTLEHLNVAIQVLRVGGSHRITDAGLKHLEKLDRLETLVIYGTGVTASGAEALGAKLPNCRIIFEEADARAMDEL